MFEGKEFKHINCRLDYIIEIQTHIFYAVQLLSGGNNKQEIDALTAKLKLSSDLLAQTLAAINESKS